MIDIMLSIKYPLVTVRHLVGHSRPASVGSLRFVYRRVCGIALVQGIRFQFLLPTGDFRFFVSGSVTGYHVIG